ncbi:MAG: choice-of-anchor D domain-containing protein, partial [Planctomycetes bacterium]|nr:choice-of-anchor D domain-containing protein [Planctomycetota bacterium]
MRLPVLLLLLSCAAPLFAQPDILYYKFDETSGAQARNSAIPGQGWTNGSLSAAPLWNTTDPAVAPAAVDNIGQARKMSTGYSLSERNGQAFTIEFWFRTASGGYQDFCNDSNTFGLWLNGGQIEVYLNGSVALNSSGGLSDGQWHYCALTRDAGNNYTLYWGNGSGTLSTDTATNNLTFSSNAFEMLYWQAQVPATYNGEMDEFRLWGVERTQAQLEANRNTPFSTQDLELFDPSMQFIKHQGTSNYTNVAAGTFTDYTFTVQNVRTSGNVAFSPVTLTGIAGCTANVITQPTGPLTPGSTTTFTVRVTPLQAEFNFLVNVNNDRTPNPYQFTFNGMMNTGRPEMLYYRFNEGSGTTARNDASPGRGLNPATFSVGPSWTGTGNARLGANAVQNNSNLPTGFSCTDLPRPEFTLEFWVWRNNTSTVTICGDNTAFRVYRSGSGGGTGSPNHTLRIQSGPSGGNQNINTGLTVTESDWTHFAIVSEPGVSGLRVYRNGTLGFEDVNYTFPFVDAPLTVFRNGGTGGNFSGRLDEFRFWAQARTQAQISANMNNELIGRLEVRRLGPVVIPNGGSHALGSVSTGVPVDLTYTLANTGSTGLLMGNPAVTFSGNSNCAVSVTTNPSGALIPALSTTPAVVQVTPAAPGPFSVQLQFASNDPDVPSYVVNISGTATGSAQIQLERPALTVIPHLGTDPVTGAVAGVTSNLTYVIRNPGTLPLDITGQNATLTSNCNVVVGLPTVDPVGAGGTSNLPVSVTPVAAGAFSFRLNVTSNAPSQPTYTIIVSGNAAVGGEINIQRTISIADGGTDTVTGAVAGVTTVLTYTIQNLGTANLTLTGASPVSGNTPVNLGFASIIQPGSGVLTPSGPGSTTTFQVGLTPAASGTFSLQLVVASDDLNENPYNINITGSAAAGGEIHVERPVATNLADGATDPLGGGHVAGVPLVLTYTVRNQGTAALTISGASVGNFVNCTAGVTSALPGSIANGGAATLQITVTPGAAGIFSFEIDISSDDVDEGNYDILASGTAITGGEIHVQRPLGTDLFDGDPDTIAGSPIAGIGTALNYTVFNQGTAALGIVGVVISNQVNCGVVITGALPASIANGANAPLQLTVTPVDDGAFSFDFYIDNDDVSESQYDIHVQGNALPGGEINVQRPIATNILDGATDPLGAGHVAGVAIVLDYTVYNFGSAELEIAAVAVTNAVNCSANVTITLPGAIANGFSAPLQVTVTPATDGPFSFDLSIFNDDQNENPYDIHVDGSAIPGGEIDLTRGIPLADTDTDDAGSGHVAGVPLVLTYTVANLGSSVLNIGGVVIS